MSYELYGYITVNERDGASIRCEDCTQHWLETELDITEPEVRYLMQDGADKQEIFTRKEKMREWPVRDEHGETVYNEETDEPCMRKEVDFYGEGAIEVLKNDAIYRLKKRCIALYRDGTESLDGEWCENCSVELVPVHIELCSGYGCSTEITRGQEEYDAAISLPYQMRLCKGHYEAYLHEAFSNIADAIDEIKVEDDRDRNVLQDALNACKQNGIMATYERLGRKLSLADAQTPLAQFLYILSNITDEYEGILFIETEHDITEPIPIWKQIAKIRGENTEKVNTVDSAIQLNLL